MELPLFRPDAVHPNRRSHIGEIVLIRPISLTLLTGLAAAAAVVTVSFLVWGSYTKRSTSSGHLVPDLGVIKVYVSQTGTIIEKNVVEGQFVKRGDTLYALTSERRSSAFGETQVLISEQARTRIRGLREQIESTQSMARSDIVAALDKLAGLRNEQKTVAELISVVRLRMELSDAKQRRYNELRDKGYVSQDQYLTVRFEMLDQRERLDGLERDRISLDRQIGEQQALLKTLPVKYATQVAEYEGDIAEAEAALTESESRREWLVVAPESGTATAVVGELGQTLDANRSLLSIIPNGAQLQARLYATSDSVGFVKSGDAVYLRVHGYPYQKFGHYRGTVAYVSRISASSAELIGDDALDSILNKGEPVYQITVVLASQSALAYGKQYPLQAGMLVDAEVMQESRRLYEWVLEPLLTLTGRMK